VTDAYTCVSSNVNAVAGAAPASSSGASAFAWREAPLSECSAPCGGGYMMAHAVCVANATGVRVHQDLCDGARRPRARMAPCNNRPCPPR